MFEKIMDEQIESVSYETKIQTVVPSPSESSCILSNTELMFSSEISINFAGDCVKLK